MLAGDIGQGREGVTVNLRLVDAKNMRITGRVRHTRPGSHDTDVTNGVTEALWELMEQMQVKAD